MKYTSVLPYGYEGVVACAWELRFESSVISYGSQTHIFLHMLQALFESSVISYGSQTFNPAVMKAFVFESSVISYGSQTTELYTLTWAQVWE